MSQDLVVQLFRELLKSTLILMAPMLIASIIVGMLVSIFQAATQIHEMTLVFVPKILVIVAVPHGPLPLDDEFRDLLYG